MIYLNLFLLTCIVVFIVDLSGFTNSWKAALARLLNCKPEQIRSKPFGCSLCMTFWTGMVYAICVGHFTIGVLAYVCLLAFLTIPIGQALLCLSAGLAKILTIIKRKL